MLRQLLEIIPFYLLITFLKLMPFEKRVYWGGQLCKIVLPRIRKFRKRVDTNLRFVYPNMSYQKRKEFIKENSKMIGESFIELMFNKEFQNLKNKITFKKKELTPLIEARKIERPIIVISGHIGSWEAVRAVLNKNGLTSGSSHPSSTNSGAICMKQARRRDSP